MKTQLLPSQILALVLTGVTSTACPTTPEWGECPEARDQLLEMDWPVRTDGTVELNDGDSVDPTTEEGCEILCRSAADAAMATLVEFDTFMRPGEIVNLKIEHCYPPQPGMIGWALNVAPQPDEEGTNKSIYLIVNEIKIFLLITDCSRMLIIIRVYPCCLESSDCLTKFSTTSLEISAKSIKDILNH